MNKQEIIKSIDEQKEQSQQDVMCILDGIDNEYLDNVCQVIVDRFNIIKNNISERVWALGDNEVVALIKVLNYMEDLERIHYNACNESERGNHIYNEITTLRKYMGLIKEKSNNK